MTISLFVLFITIANFHCYYYFQYSTAIIVITLTLLINLTKDFLVFNWIFISFMSFLFLFQLGYFYLN